ncbi:glutamate N-acetyltransferase [Thiogranum longum]|uniref:Arginine biosynthesis bifunctional protein ArgJ n=1 Tax=Thiogranum longum TaxID=1537524 RepID=A0A4R1H6F2_9GAMM|nr:bifunctional glutamate N-acetyltransferase/amino-acid acetyltransferase ArgJ [Thiogranum longum]TCK17327.1 glutamate N-acetyltransferase [Thiogranum longum]
MPVGYSELPELSAVAGVRLSAQAAQVRYEGRDDLVVMELAEGSRCAAVFTRNAFCAAPVIVAREHLAQHAPRYLLINSGNANAGTGAPGLDDARRSCAALAKRAGCDAAQVLPFSTGVIGERLPVQRIESALDGALANLSENNWSAAAHAIMTTDTVAKGVSLTLSIDGQTVTLTGMAKGSGMIRPDMATMLAYIATDAAVESSALQNCIQQAVEQSFNRITVDGDTSTNDACVLVATGASGAAVLDDAHPDYPAFCAAVSEVSTRLSQLIVRDGEGATKFVTVRVEGGHDSAECLQVAYTVAHSPLVKTALFASDPNWGRILAAVGRAGLSQLDIEQVELWLDDVCIVRDGGVAQDYTEADGQRVMNQDEILIRIALGRGAASETIWTSDLSHDYVSINADYRS